MVQRYMGLGLPKGTSQFLASLEVIAANGGENLAGDEVKQVTGRPPVNFETFAFENKEAWS